MNDLKELLNIDFSSTVLLFFTCMSGIVAGAVIIEKFWGYVSKPIRWVFDKIKGQNNDHDRLEQVIQELSSLHDKHEADNEKSVRNEEMICSDLQMLRITVNEVVNRLDTMQSKIDATEMAKLKDKLWYYYMKYKDVGEWDRYESDIFWGLYDSYISHGGNSFIKDKVEPVMRSLKVKE